MLSYRRRLHCHPSRKIKIPDCLAPFHRLRLPTQREHKGDRQTDRGSNYHSEHYTVSRTLNVHYGTAGLEWSGVGMRRKGEINIVLKPWLLLWWWYERTGGGCRRREIPLGRMSTALSLLRCYSMPLVTAMKLHLLDQGKMSTAERMKTSKENLPFPNLSQRNNVNANEFL